MVTIPEFKEVINRRILEIKIETDYSALDGLETIESWQTLNMTERTLTIQLQLINMNKISLFENPDRLKVTVKEPKLFISQSPHQFLGGDLEPFLFLEAQAYFDHGSTVIIEEIAKILRGAGWIALALNFLTNLLMQVTLQLVFTLMNTL